MTDLFDISVDRIRKKVSQVNRAGVNRVVYTANLNGYDTVAPPRHVFHDTLFVCFVTDATELPLPWVPVQVTMPKGVDPTRVSRYLKVNPHLWFPDMEVSLWMDANIRLQATAQEVFGVLGNAAMATREHPVRTNIRAEVAACIQLGKDDGHVLQRQLREYEGLGFPDEHQLFETNVLLRRHHDEGVVKLMRAWWDEIGRGSRRDQVSLPFVQWTTKVEILVMPSRLLLRPADQGDHSAAYFFLQPHRRKKRSRTRGVVKRWVVRVLPQAPEWKRRVRAQWARWVGKSSTKGRPEGTQDGDFARGARLQALRSFLNTKPKAGPLRKSSEVALRRFLGINDLSTAVRGAFLQTVPQRPRFAVVLLQYGSLDHTKRCVESLEAFQSRINLDIVVVDNFTSDEVVGESRRLFSTGPGRHLILRDANDGYAQGNNEGYRYARTSLQADFIIVVNNDVLFEDARFFQRLIAVYKKTAYSVLGPDIQVRSPQRTIHQNPGDIGIRDVGALQRKRALIEARLARPATEDPELYQIRGRRRKQRRSTEDRELHGSALVFSPLFVRDFDEPFDPRTFLYLEERILFLRALSRGHKMLYASSLFLVHNTHQSKSKGSAAYNRWRDTRLLESLKVLEKVVYELDLASPPESSRSRPEGRN